MQHAAFPLQFEFLFDFPGPLGETRLEGANAVERFLMMVETTSAKLFGGKNLGKEVRWGAGD